MGDTGTGAPLTGLTPGGGGGGHKTADTTNNHTHTKQRAFVMAIKKFQYLWKEYNTDSHSPYVYNIPVPPLCCSH